LKSLIEVTFEGADKCKGPQVLVSKSKEMAEVNGIRMPGIDCVATDYKLVEPQTNKQSQCLGYCIASFALGIILSYLF